MYCVLCIYVTWSYIMHVYLIMVLKEQKYKYNTNNYFLVRWYQTTKERNVIVVTIFID